MGQGEKETDGKLYRVYHKKGNHQNTKKNPDGSKAAIQFTNEDNGLDGPLDLIEVDEREFVKTEYVEVDQEPRTFKQIIIEDVVAPIAREVLEQALDIGFQYISVQMEQKVVPKLKVKAKEFSKKMNIVFEGIKEEVTGKKTKNSRLIRESEQERTTAVAVKKEAKIKKSKPMVHKSNENMQVRSQEEIQQILGAMKSSALMLATCIRMLNNSIVADDGSDPEKRLEIQRNIQELTTTDVMDRIDLLLEDKNRDLLDQASLRLVAAFRHGNFIVDGEEVPIQKYLESK